MKKKINDVFNLVEDWDYYEIDRLISELECLRNDKDESL